MKTLLPNSIETVQQAKELFIALHNNGETYHPEDDASEIVGITGKDLFTEDEAQKLNKLMGDVYALPEVLDNYKFDPCGFLCGLNAGLTLVQIDVLDTLQNQCSDLERLEAEKHVKTIFGSKATDEDINLALDEFYK